MSSWEISWSHVRFTHESDPYSRVWRAGSLALPRCPRSEATQRSSAGARAGLRHEPPRFMGPQRTPRGESATHSRQRCCRGDRRGGRICYRIEPGQRVLIAPMHFCNHCAKCVAGLQNQCPEFTVLGNAVDGGDCELIAVPAVNVIPIPHNLDFNQAASVSLVFLTAWHMLVGRAGIRPGQTVLVLGANSGVGIAAIQIAKLFHARVITTAGDEKKLEKALALGADHGINHYKQKISEEVRKITNKEGVDIVIEHVGAATWEESVKSLKPAGTLVTCGATTGPNVGLELRFVYSRQLSILGSHSG